MDQMVQEFYSDANPVNIPTFYDKKSSAEVPEKKPL